MNTLRFLSEGDGDKPWGAVLGACLVAQMVTLTGVFMSGTMGLINKVRTRNGKASLWDLVHTIVVPGFAAGALLATAVFLLVPESLTLIAGGHAEHEEEHEDEHRMMRHRFLADEVHDEHEGEESSESETAWKFGASLLAGFLFPAILHAIFPTPHEEDREHDEDQIGETVPVNSQTEDEEAKPERVEDEPNSEPLKAKAGSADLTTTETDPDSGSVRNVKKDWGLATSILVGDAFHNFTDGVFTGTAFLLCGSETGWTIVATTIYHELAQEIADYALLTHHCGFGKWQALGLNFVAGFSMFLGGVVVLATDVNDLAQGIILAISAGVYFYIGGAECVPRAQRAAHKAKQTLLFLGCFVLGVVPIGLVLLNHGHCEAAH